MRIRRRDRTSRQRRDVAEPGVIHHTEGNRISFGEPDGTRSDRTRKIAEALISAGFRCPITTRVRHEIWVKLIGNVAFNPISALTRASFPRPEPMNMRRCPFGAKTRFGFDALGDQLWIGHRPFRRI